MSMGKQLIIGLLLLVLLLFSFLFNKSIIDIRLEEIDYHLNRVALEDKSSQTFSIISRYELIKRRIESGDVASEDYTGEGRMQVVLATNTIPQLQSATRKMSPWHPVRLTLAGMRFLLRKEQIGTQEVVAAIEELEQAYLFERQRNYKAALGVYEKILTKPFIPPKVHASVLMHKAFCLSLLSNYEESAAMYQQVVDTYGDTPEGVLSLRLLEFLTSMEEKKNEVALASKNKHEMGKRLYTYMDYRGAIKELDTYLKSPQTIEKKSAHFYKGRSHEELGEYRNAVDEYRSVLRLDGRGEWAQKANRRLVMLGTFYEQRNSAIATARKELVKQGDTAFVKEVEALGTIVEETKRERREKTLAQAGVALKEPATDRDTLRLLDSLALVDSTTKADSLLRLREAWIKDSIATADSIVKSRERQQQEIREKERLEDEKRRLEKRRERARLREQRRQAQIEAERLRKERMRREEERKAQEKEKAEEENRRRKKAREQKMRDRKKRLASSEYRNSAYIKSSIEKNIPSFRELYLKYAKAGEDVAGKIVVEMEISAEGTIKAKVVSSTIDNSGFRRDIVKQIESWRFPAVDKELGSMRIRYPFSFKQRVSGK